MIVLLDHLCFGNGHGLRTPYFDDIYFWLVDTSSSKRKGELYKFSPGFGAQLYSYGWFHPIAGTERELKGKTFRVFSSSRSLRFPFRVEIAWGMVFSAKDTEEIRQLRDELFQL